MTHNIPETRRLHRLWNAVTEASAVMVAIHYAAPWSEPRAVQGTHEKRRCQA